MASPQKPHIVCIPSQHQGHINPMMKLINILHSKNFYITLVLFETSFATLTSSMGSEFLSLRTRHDFRIETIPDGLPSDSKRGVKELSRFALSLKEEETKKTLKGLLTKLLGCHDIPPISNIITDGLMFFALEVGKELCIPVCFLVAASAGTILGLLHHGELVKKGHFPLKDESYLTNGYLETPIDYIPGLNKEAKFKHLCTFARTTDPNEAMLNFSLESVRQLLAADAVIFNTFSELEGQVLKTMQNMIPNHYTIGPLAMLCQRLRGQERLPYTLSLWKEDTKCLEWLDKRAPNSVIYVNFGSMVILTRQQLEELAWGLAKSNRDFVWVIRSDIVDGGSSALTEEYMKEIEGRGYVSSWCPQVEVLRHPSIAVFFTHCGWNSILEGVCEGVPMVCWPYFGDQPVNCLYACQEWKIGLEMDEGKIERGKVEELVREVMDGEKGKEIKTNAMEWKKKAQEATRFGGSSYKNIDELVKYLKRES